MAKPPKRLIHIPMLLSLCLSLTGLIFTGVQPLAKPGPALPVGPVPVSLVGLDVRTDFLAQGWPLPSQLSALLASPQPASESGHSLTKAPSLLASQDDDGCKLNGKEFLEFLVGEPGETSVLTTIIPFVCPNGVTIMRQVTHTVRYRKITWLTTKYRSSPTPGVVCPPLVTNQEYTEVASETWEYGPKSGCPGECCVLRKVTISKEYNFGDMPIPIPYVYHENIICPDGSPGIKTIRMNKTPMHWRSVTVQEYDSVCPNVNCPQNTSETPWNLMYSRISTEVTNNCTGQDPLATGLTTDGF